VAAGTKRYHQVELGNARHAVMHDDRTLVATGRSADATAILIALQNLLPQAAEVFLILPLQGVTGRT
jgi:hypothetical protein